MKPKYVYHGSINGEIKVFEPRSPSDVGTNLDNKHKGVYATSLKKWAMIMGIIADEGVNLSSINEPELEGIIFRGKPNHKYFYLYTFDSDKFENIPAGGNQYICKEKITPLKVEAFLVKDYMKWIRDANEKEIAVLKKEIGDKKFREIME